MRTFALKNSLTSENKVDFNSSLISDTLKKVFKDSFVSVYTVFMTAVVIFERLPVVRRMTLTLTSSLTRKSSFAVRSLKTLVFCSSHCSKLGWRRQNLS